MNGMSKFPALLVLSIWLLVIPTAYSGLDLQQQFYFARDNVMPALVHIQPVIKNYKTGELEKQSVVGSGIIFHPDGYVVTNYHVAGRAERIICTLDDKELVKAEYIGGDPMTDIAVIKLDLSDYKGIIKVAELGDSDLAQVGQYVMAMGSPLSLSRSVSVGVISTKDRYFSNNVRLPSGERTGKYNLWIQTDAAINPGNSGGPLVDLTGKVIGINSRATLFANNLGFAIPVNVVKEVTEAILTDGKMTRSWIGLQCQALQELEDYFGMEQKTGVLVSSIIDNSPAEKGFLKAGDIILELNGESVSARFKEELPLFYAQIAKISPGSEIQLKVLRNEEIYTFQIITSELGANQGDIFECKGWGLTVKDITRQMIAEDGIKDSLGVFVEGVKNSIIADDGGLRRGDVISKINNIEINDLAGFVIRFESITENKDENVFLTIKRNGATRFVVHPIDKDGGDDKE